MPRPQQSPALERLVKLLIDGADDAVLDHILLDAVESLELAEAIALWRIGSSGELQTSLTCGTESELPSGARLSAHLRGDERLGSNFHVAHAAIGRGRDESAIVMVLFDRNLCPEVEAADSLLEICARSLCSEQDQEDPPAPLPAAPMNAVERELAHDLRNHLAGLRTVCEVLQVLEQELQEDERDHYGQIIQRECRRAGELLASALESEHQPAHSTSTCDSELVLALRDVVAAETAAYRLSNAELRVRIEAPPAERNFRLGAFDFSRVVRNLLVNIREACASPAGPATRVFVELQADKSGCGGLVLAVEDDGPGIAPHIRAHLFEEGVSTKAQLDSGSGLAAVKSIVEGVGGEIRVQHLPMRGTRFQVWIPESSRD